MKNPIGTATQKLIDGNRNEVYNIYGSDLVQGFSDPDGGELSVLTIESNNGELKNNGNGNEVWTFMPSLNYTGLVTLNYVVSDDNGGEIEAKQSFNVTPANQNPKGGVMTQLATGKSNESYNIYTNDLLQGFIDTSNAGALTVLTIQVNHGELTASSDGWIFMPETDYKGLVTINYIVSNDNDGETEATQNFNLITSNHPPTGSVTISGNPTQGQILTASNSLADVDGLGLINYQWLNESSPISGANQATYALTLADVGKAISVKASYTDLQGTAESVMSSSTVLVAPITPVVPVISPIVSDSTIITPTFNGLTKIGDAKNNTLTGANKNDDLSGLAGNDTLLGKVGNDRLNGGDGKDNLMGGLGFDSLTGEIGADKFIFTSIKDAPLSRINIEIITDFNHKEGDKIDLSTIDANVDIAKNQVFTKPTIGAEFSGEFTKAGQLFFETSTHILYGNVNKDGAADFAIQLNGVNSLSASDFIL